MAGASMLRAASAIAYAAAMPMAGAPRTRIERIASTAPAASLTRAHSSLAGSRV